MGKVLPSMALWNLIIAICFVLCGSQTWINGRQTFENNLSRESVSAWKKVYLFENFDSTATTTITTTTTNG